MMNTDPDWLSITRAVKKEQWARLSGCLAAVVAVIVFSGLAIASVCFFVSLPSLGPLQKAARDGFVGEMDELLKSGVPIDDRCEYLHWTALHAAAYFGQYPAAEFLINHGAAIDPRDDRGYTPLALCGDGPSHGPSKDTEFARNKIAQLLIAHGANVKSKTNSGVGLRALAVMGDDPELQHILLNAGAPP